MSYQAERDQFIARMTREGLPLQVTTALLRAATTLQRYAELACSSEAADRDRVKCPRALAERKYATKPIKVATAAFERYPCLCDNYQDGKHEDVPRYRVREAALERRIGKLLEGLEGWSLDHQGDPRGYVLRVIPPSYAERNQGRDRCNRESIGVPSRDTGLRF